MHVALSYLFSQKWYVIPVLTGFPFVTECNRMFSNITPLTSLSNFFCFYLLYFDLHPCILIMFFCQNFQIPSVVPIKNYFSLHVHVFSMFSPWSANPRYSAFSKQLLYSPLETHQLKTGPFLILSSSTYNLFLSIYVTYVTLQLKDIYSQRWYLQN